MDPAGMVIVAVVDIRDAVERNSEPSSLRRSHFADGRARFQWVWMWQAFWVCWFVWMVVQVGVDVFNIRSSNRGRYCRRRSLCDEQNPLPRLNISSLYTHCTSYVIAIIKSRMASMA